MKTVKINLYSFNELNDTAKEKAIFEALDFLDNEPIEYEEESGEMKSKYVEHSETDAIEFIEANEYYFFSDGEQAHVIEYAGKHPRAGEIDFKFRGETIKI